MANELNTTTRTRDMVLIAMFAAIAAICSWITVPTSIPFTMQTFAVFIAVGLLGGKRGTLAILVWILLGAVGLPVFSGFSGGLGIILGSTGGYIIGFLVGALFMWGMEKVFGTRPIPLIIAMVAALLIAYTLGTIWFIVVYNGGNADPVGLMTVLGWCVFPFIPFDLGKIALAYFLTLRLKRYVPR